MYKKLHMLALAVLVAACADDDIVIPQQQEVTAPQVGSTFVVARHKMDPSGAKRPDSDAIFNRVVASRGVTFDGRTGVWTVITYRDSIEEATDTTYSYVDGQGHLVISEGDENTHEGPIWFRYPLAIGKVAVDTISYFIVNDKIPQTFRLIGRTEHVADERIDIDGRSIETYKFATTFWMRSTVEGILLDSTSVGTTRWFAPSLGVFVRDSLGAYFFNDDPSPGEFRSVVRYALK